MQRSLPPASGVRKKKEGELTTELPRPLGLVDAGRDEAGVGAPGEEEEGEGAEHVGPSHPRVHHRQALAHVLDEEVRRHAHQPHREQQPCQAAETPVSSAKLNPPPPPLRP
jgi:hypothetical protein